MLQNLAIFVKKIMTLFFLDYLLIADAFFIPKNVKVYNSNKPYSWVGWVGVGWGGLAI
jgi:hypothetical protein